MLQRTTLPQARWPQQHERQQQQCIRSKQLSPATCAATSSGRGADKTQRISSHEQEQMRNVIIATTMCCVFATNVRAARAEGQTWVPRRHHRHIGERFTDTWADTIVEAEHATASRVRDLERQLEHERKRADSEAARRREAEQKLKVATLQQRVASRSAEDDTPLSIKVAGADITAPLAFLTLFGGVYYGWQQSKVAAGKQQKGRWVYDRSLGGKKVWVPYADGSLPEVLTDAAFDELASKAANRAAAQRKQQLPYQAPVWWQPPMSFAADDATRAAAQPQASAILARIEQQKNRGEDYKLADIALLRRTCQAGGGVTVDTRTVGGRDAIYKAAVDAAVRRCVEPSSIDETEMADHSPLQFVAGVAQDLQIPDERAVSLACNWVAGHCRARLVEAYTAAKKGEDVAVAQALVQLSSLLQGLPVLEANSSQVGLIADELQGWADAEVLQRLQDAARNFVESDQQKVVIGMLGL